MENQYYTPSPEEFCIGFIFELKVGPETWKEIVVKGEQRITHDGKSLTWGEYCQVNPQFMRVRILDTEIFQRLGFEFKNKVNERNDSYSANGYTLVYRPEDCLLRFANMRRSTYTTNRLGKPVELSYMQLFQGIIKNQTDLERMLKQVGYENNNEDSKTK